MTTALKFWEWTNAGGTRVAWNLGFNINLFSDAALTYWLSY